MKHLWKKEERLEVESKYRDNPIYKAIRLATPKYVKDAEYCFSVPELFYHVIYCIDIIRGTSFVGEERCDECRRMWNDIFEYIHNKKDDVPKEDAESMASQVIMFVSSFLLSLDSLHFYDEGVVLISSINTNDVDGINRNMSETRYFSQTKGISKILSDYYYGDSFISDEIENLLQSKDVDEEDIRCPQITGVQRTFFVDTVRNGDAKKVAVPVDRIMHTIYKETQQWDSEKKQARKWKILYKVLLDLKYFKVEVRPRFSEYVKSVVQYCLYKVPDGFSNSISKTKLPNNVKDWKEDDKRLYDSLKSALAIV